jgi:hypothetical protein
MDQSNELYLKPSYIYFPWTIEQDIFADFLTAKRMHLDSSPNDFNQTDEKKRKRKKKKIADKALPQKSCWEIAAFVRFCFENFLFLSLDKICGIIQAKLST